MGNCVSQHSGQVPVSSTRTRDLPSIISLPASVQPSLVLGDKNHSHQVTSEGIASLGEPEEDGNHSPASSRCSATYGNLGQSRANMIPLKQPRNIKSSSDTLASIDLDSSTAPPPLPRKAVPRSSTEPGPLRSQAEAKSSGTNLSMANPLYDLDTTWETASQSSSISSEAHRAHESTDSLERPPATSRASSLVPQPPPAAPSSTDGKEAFLSTESLSGRGESADRGGSKPQRPAAHRSLDGWNEVVARIRGLHTDTLRKLSSKCEDRFMEGQKDHLRFGTDSWSHFRLTTGKPCCEAGDAVYYTASYAKDPLVSYAIKICRSRLKDTKQQFFHSLAVRQSLPVHFNIQQDCGHFLADVPNRMLPWEMEEQEEIQMDPQLKASRGKLGEASGSLRNRVVVITREVPFQTVADFVRDGEPRHDTDPELYERQVCFLLLQLCSGLEHMKPHHVTHCDLRLENLLLVRSPLGNLDLLEPNNNSSDAPCPARLIISNFSQAKQKSSLIISDPAALRDHSRLAPEIITATQYRKCDEFQTGILIYEMLHRPNPFEEVPDLKEREYTWAELPMLPVRSPYSQGLQQLARLLLTANPTERIQMSEARAGLQCTIWGPQKDLFQPPGTEHSIAQHHATLQNWLDLKRTLMMIKFAERSLDMACSVSLEDWLCCQYLAFTSTDSLNKVVHILQHPPPNQTHPLRSTQPPRL